MMFESVQWRNELLQKIGAYGASDPKLLEIAGTICAKQSLSPTQQQYAADFELKVTGEHPNSLWGALRL